MNLHKLIFTENQLRCGSDAMDTRIAKSNAWTIGNTGAVAEKCQ